MAGSRLVTGMETAQTTLDATRRPGRPSAIGGRPGHAHVVGRALALAGWFGLAVAGSLLVLAAAALAAGLAVALGTVRLAGRLRPAAARGRGARRSPEPWPAVVDGDAG